MGFFDRFKAPDLDAGLARFRETPGAILLDVREADEFATGHIPNSVSLPLSEIDTVETLIPDRGTPIFAYCLVGSRSRQAAARLRSLGYQKVESIGGIRSYRGELEYGS